MEKAIKLKSKDDQLSCDDIKNDLSILVVCDRNEAGVIWMDNLTMGIYEDLMFGCLDLIVKIRYGISILKPKAISVLRAGG